ncbi:MAG: alpha-2,8-polysialyltransferase family protein [Proteobacteria bacterium]|nr:alpha-2,8-polysialyltransferase family protein [Pseudomonadota bacterium]
MPARLRKILFFSCEPGGAEALIPVIRLVEAQPHCEAIVLGFGHALERFAKKEIACDEIGSVQMEDFSLLDHHEPDLLITSATSLPSVDMTEKYLWRQTKQRGIPSLAFLDQWQNYAVRFSGNQDLERLAYQPDWINCLNETGREEMIREGFEQSRLVAFGQPYLSSLKHDLSTLDVARLKARLRISAGDKVALFVSEPIREYYGDTRGYDQYQVLDYFLSNLADTTERPEILVKLHPKDNRASFQVLAERFETLSPQFIGNELSPIESLAVSDFIFGMSSIMLIEAYVLGKMVASLQPGLRGEDPLVLTRHKLVPMVSSGEKRNLLELNCSPHARFDVEFATEKFLHFLGRIIQ